MELCRRIMEWKIKYNIMNVLNSHINYLTFGSQKRHRRRAHACILSKGLDIIKGNLLNDSRIYIIKRVKHYWSNNEGLEQGQEDHIRRYL
jgi:hypothetical protein